MKHKPQTFAIVEKAPWDEDTVKKLNKQQQNDEHNAMKCKNGHKYTATSQGWICKSCNEKQDWCWGLTLTI